MGTRSRKKCQFITKHSLSFVPVDMARLKGEPGRTRHEHKDEKSRLRPEAAFRKAGKHFENQSALFI